MKTGKANLDKRFVRQLWYNINRINSVQSFDYLLSLCKEEEFELLTSIKVTCTHIYIYTSI